jgi:hypothetical protein
MRNCARGSRANVEVGEACHAIVIQLAYSSGPYAE